MRPFRGALALGAALVVVDAADHARRAAAGAARHRRRHRHRSTPRALRVACVAFLAVQLLSWANARVDAAADRPHRRAGAVRAAGPHVRPPATAVARLLRPRAGRPDHDPHDHRRRGAGPAVAAGPGHRRGQPADVRGGRGGAVRPRRCGWRWRRSWCCPCWPSPPWPSSGRRGAPTWWPATASPRSTPTCRRACPACGSPRRSLASEGSEARFAALSTAYRDARVRS